MLTISIEKRAEALAWVFFLGLNFLIFLPRFILEVSTSVWLPLDQFFAKEPYEKAKFFVTRANYDFFRFSFDLIILLSAFLLFRNFTPKKFAASAFGALYVFIILYGLYFNAFEKIYQTNPLFYNDLISLKTAFYITWDSLGYMFFPALVLVVAVLGAVYFLAKRTLTLFARIKITVITYLMAGALLLLSFITLFTQGLHLKTNASVQFFLYSFSKNTIESIATHKEIKNLSPEIMKLRLTNADQPLPVKPNIYFIFIESYGRFAYDNPTVAEAHKPVLTFESKRLKDEGYHIASGLSESPVTGGISWLAYTSMLYGFNIDKQGTYYALLRDTAWYNYPHWTRMLKHNGYNNYRLSSIAPNDRMVIPWDIYSKFYAVDQWITWKDLNYKGKVYGFGPSPPDQYALNFGQQVIDSAGKKPYSLFFISQNSHSPFFSPTNVSENWQSLSDGSLNEGQRSRFLDKPTITDYASAMNYQVSYLSDFIRKRKNKDDIYILAGDHQPPLITTKEDNFQTPLYIISGDSTLIKRLYNFGYQKNLLLDTNAAGFISHSDVYHHFLAVIHGAEGRPEKKEGTIDD